jgi:hypothetical protein
MWPQCLKRPQYRFGCTNIVQKSARTNTFEVRGCPNLNLIATLPWIVVHSDRVCLLAFAAAAIAFGHRRLSAPGIVAMQGKAEREVSLLPVAVTNQQCYTNCP